MNIKLSNSEVIKLPTHYGSVRIIEMGSWVPDNIIETAELQEVIDTRPELRSFNILEKVGVEQRRTTPDDVSVLDMTEKASLEVIRKSLDRTDFDINDIDTIIYSSVSRMYAEPATATLLQKRLGINYAMSFDVSDACLSFIDGLILADSLIAAGRSKLVLVAGAERFSDIVRNSKEAILSGERGADCLPSFTIGDGAVAALLSDKTYGLNGRLKLHAFSRTTIGEYSECCIMPSLDGLMSTDSYTMFNASLSNYPKMLKDLLEDIGWDLGEVDAIVPHQASLKIVKKAMELIDYPFEKCVMSIDKYGNMGAMSLPFTLKKAIEEKNLKSGSKIVVLAFGSGLSFSMMAYEVI